MVQHPDSILIVGACQAGVQIASSLRDFGYEGVITMIGAETHPPYQRPPLSKALLKGEAGVEDLFLRSEEFYREQRIELVLGERVTSLERGIGGTGIARTDAGRAVAFDRLALAVGSRARRLQVPGVESDGVLYLRDADDAFALKRRLVDARRIVVVGGGFIGLEVAASARTLGKEVAVVLPSERLLARAVGSVTGEFIRDEHVSRGVRIATGHAVTRVVADESGAVVGVITAAGEELGADLVIVGIGADPRVELGRQFGLVVEGGIQVDAHAVASDGHTVAAGDCTNMPNPLVHGHGAERLRLESVNNATEQAKVAAASLLQAPTPYRTIPWFWSDQYDVKLQVAGIPDGHDDVVIRGEVSGRKFSVLYYLRGELMAVECINNPAEFTQLRGALLRGLSLARDVAADTTISLRQALASPARELRESA